MLYLFSLFALPAFSGLKSTAVEALKTGAVVGTGAFAAVGGIALGVKVFGNKKQHTNINAMAPLPVAAPQKKDN